MNYKKALIASAVSAAVGGSALTAHAAAITSITLGDISYGFDDTVSGFRFVSGAATFFPTGTPGTFPNDLTFGSTDELCGGSGGGTAGPWSASMR